MAAERTTFTAEGKTFTVVGNADADIGAIDAWLRGHNLPRLSTHLSIAGSLPSRGLLIVYKSTDHHLLSLEMTEVEEGSSEVSVPKLEWLWNCHVRKGEDGERKVTYERREVTETDRKRGCSIEERGRTADGLVTIGFSAMPEDNITAMRMRILTPAGIDSGLSEWRCGINIAGVMYWVHYLYLEIAVPNVVAYMLMEDMEGKILVAEAPVETSIVTAFSTVFA